MLLLAPVIWLVALPFRIVGICIRAVLALLRQLLFLPARLLDTAAESSNTARKRTDAARAPPGVSGTASCSCGQLRIQVEGEPRGVGVCHCLACQQRTGSVFAALASFSAPFKVFGTATEYVRVGDQGAKFRFRFCPVCGTNLFHTEDGVAGSVGVAVGAFADPTFPAPQVSVYDCRRHAWVQLPPGIATFDKDPA